MTINPGWPVGLALVLLLAVTLAAHRVSRYGLERPVVVAALRAVAQLAVAALVIAAVVRSAKIEPRNLVLEITESSTMDDPDALGLRLRDLKALGVGVALDDFGTGWSSLSMLSSAAF